MIRSKRRAHLTTTRAFLGNLKSEGQVESFLTMSAILDISETGAQILSSRPLQKNQSVELLWAPVTGMKALSLKGHCIWVEKNKAGIRFQELSRKAKAVIHSLVKFHVGPAELNSK